MYLNSKYFDSIRQAPRRKACTSKLGAHARRHCDWAGCSADGDYPGPVIYKQYPHPYQKQNFFCEHHIALHNRNHDFFEGMSTRDILAWQNEAVYGHRPTWKLGTRSARNFDPYYIDPLHLFNNDTGNSRERASSHPRYISQGQRRALKSLGLTPAACPQEIRTRYKQLLKRFHPDTNSGNRLYEAKLQRAIKAYQYLKASGFC